jgi:hypothetical protein
VWCAATQTPEAVSGGFFVREPYRALGAPASMRGSAPESRPVVTALACVGR